MVNPDRRYQRTPRSQRQSYLALVREADEQRCAYGHAGLGDLAISEGKPEAAVRHLRRALDLAPQESRYHYLLGFAYGQLERYPILALCFQEKRPFAHGKAYAFR
jgi:Flp pilus assembly protein TadD